MVLFVGWVSVLQGILKEGYLVKSPDVSKYLHNTKVNSLGNGTSVSIHRYLTLSMVNTQHPSNSCFIHWYINYDESEVATIQLLQA